MLNGTVKWFNNSKGFGFLVQDGEAEDIFVHYSVITGSGFRTLKEGEKVIFEMTRGPKGFHAVSVRRAGDEVAESALAEPEAASLAEG